MATSELAVMEQVNLDSFYQDTQALGRNTADFIEDFYPSYMATNEMVPSIPKEHSLELLNQFTFYEICECTIHNVENRMEFFAEKMQKLFTTAYAMRRAVCYGIVSKQGKTSLLLGVDPQSNDTAIKTIVEGLLPGIKLKNYQGGFENAKVGNSGKEKDRYVGCICGVPALKIEGQLVHKDLSALMRSLNGQNYTIMVLCKPVENHRIQAKIDEAIRIQDASFAISKRTMSLQSGESEGNTHTTTHNETNTKNTSRTKGGNMSAALPVAAVGAAFGSMMGAPIPIIGNLIGGVAGGLIGNIIGSQLNFNASRTSGSSKSISEGYSDAISKTISSSTSISGDIQNGFALELMKMAESMVERLKIGRSIGIWESVVSYSSDSQMVHDIIQGSLYSEIASGIPEVLPPVVFSYKDSEQGNNVADVYKVHNEQLLIPKGFFEQNVQSPFCSLVTSEELCGICTIPVDNTVGFEIRESKNYSLNYQYQADDKALGVVCEYDRPLNNVPFGLSEYDLNKHMFVCGITGSGKTNTVKKILGMVDKPFLVIEPAKKEYRNIEKDVDVYTLGHPELNCPKMNPFYILPGISPQQHIDLLKDLFSA